MTEAFRAICATAQDANERPYLILDLRASCPDRYRLRESFDIRQPLITYEAEYSNNEEEE